MTPASREDAMLLQHPDINDDLNRLVGKMAQCSIESKRGPNGTPPPIIKIIYHRLQEATTAQESKPAYKQRWRKVEFETHMQED